MVTYTQGNLLDAQVEAVVNTVNTVGIMGKGIALMFKEAFPENFAAYEAACKRGEVQIGRMFVTENQALIGPKWIINFPTKKHWRHPAKLEWIRDGLSDLLRVLKEKHVRSVAIPPLGCGNGGLEWTLVKKEIEKAFSPRKELNVVIYAPTEKYQNQARTTGNQELSVARALIAELIRRYWILGIECTNLEVQKLAWFLERSILAMELENPLDLRFKANIYGPYADRLRHLLNGLDGSYLHCEKRISDAGPMDTIWFDDEKKATLQKYLNEHVDATFHRALERTNEIIDGFESPLGMELLATIDWLLSRGGCEPNIAAIKAGLQHWPGGKKSAERKSRLFNERMLALALERLKPAIAK